MKSGITPMKWSELEPLIAQANEVLAPPDMVSIALPRGKMLWLINAGLSEARRAGDDDLQRPPA